MEQIQNIDGAAALCRPGLCAVLYGASWCQSSLRLRDALAAHPALPVLWADIEVCPSAAAQDGVQGIPTLVLHRDGAQIARRIGMQDADKIINWLADHGIAEPRAPGRRGILERISAAALLGIVGARVMRKI